MSGETEANISGWTVDTLHQHVQTQFDDLIRLLDERHEAQQTAMRAALEAAEKAVLKAESASDKRFSETNEFRGQLRDQQSTFVSRAEAMAAIERNSERITELTDRLNRSEGKGTGLQAGWVYLLSAVAALGTVISIYLAVRG